MSLLYRTSRSLIILSLLLLTASSFTVKNTSGEEITEEIVSAEYSMINQLWETSGLEYSDISLKAFFHALSGYEYLTSVSGKHLGDHLVIVDFSQPSDRKRLVVYNVSSNTVAYTSLVAHGRNSGEHMATDFSNRVQSYQSSLGFYLTAETYEGKHGYSLRLDGIENGFNDNARDRAVVIHGADYATQDFVDQHGRLGRSYGCPSLPPEISADIITYIKEKNVLFIYADDDQYLSNSEILNYKERTLATAKHW